MIKARWAREHTLLSSAQRVGTGYTNAINAGEYTEALFYLSISAKEGTSPKLNLTLQVSPDNSDWYDTATKFTEATDVSKQVLPATTLGKFVRFSYAVTGSDTPKFTFGLQGVFKS